MSRKHVPINKLISSCNLFVCVFLNLCRLCQEAAEQLPYYSYSKYNYNSNLSTVIQLHLRKN